MIIFDLVPVMKMLYPNLPSGGQLPKEAKGWVALKAKQGNALLFEIYLSKEAIQLLLLLVTV